MGGLARDVLATHALEQYTAKFSALLHVLSMSRAFPHVVQHLREDFPQRNPQAAGMVAVVCQLVNASDLKDGWQDATASQVLIASAADLFQTYLVDVLGDLYWSRPSLIPKTELANDLAVLEGEERQLRIVEMAEEEIESMTYDPFGKLLVRVRSELKAEVDIDDSLIKRAKDASAYRHIIVHHGSRASRRFLEETRRTDVKRGQPVTIPFGDASQLADAFLEVAVRVDQGLVRKFGIEVFGPRTGKKPESQIDSKKVQEVLARLRRRDQEEGSKP